MRSARMGFHRKSCVDSCLYYFLACKATRGPRAVTRWALVQSARSDRLCWRLNWLRVGNGQAEERGGIVRGSPLRPRSHHPVRALVSSIQAEPARPGGDDGRARPVDGAYDDYALGAALRTGVRETLATVCRGGWPVMASRRDIRQDPRRLVLPLSCRRSGGQDGRLQAERQARRCGRQGVLPQSDQEPAACPHTITLDGYAASRRAVRELKADGLLSADTKLRSSKYLNNLIEQDHRGVKQRIAVMLGFKSFRNAAITIAGIELMHRIRKGQFGLGRLGVQGRVAPAVWNAVLGA